MKEKEKQKFSSTSMNSKSKQNFQQFLSQNETLKMLKTFLKSKLQIFFAYDMATTTCSEVTI